ncbi:MAG: glycosyl hydrolase [Candidatus Fermentithermobacillus carboniphilus]|uniref:Glycosyl hydrolase n=1 Tax=Candidatus Fermentithermobacillus carboniphilus TaxID=3085328 RepID=A0AAT9LAK3_9FIRM|nr:MAG: glycosyl hydrolase [Candidatus Fermentithermobacillus carboniphilus]
MSKAKGRYRMTAPVIYPRRKRPNTSLQWLLLVAVLAVLFGSMVAPSFLWVKRPPEGRPNLVYRGRVYDFPVVVEDGEAYVPFRFIKEVLDKNAFWDKEGVVVVTTADKVIKLRAESLTAYVNQHPLNLKFPVIFEGKEPYIPATTLEILYPLATSLIEENGVFLVKRLDEPRRFAQVKVASIIRAEPSVLSRRVHRVFSGSEVQIFDDVGKWVMVETKEGFSGFLPKSSLTREEVKAPEVAPPVEYSPSPVRGDKVVLVWEQVDVATPDPSKIGPMQGVNVVSPTWFHLAKTPGEVENRADMRYVNWAHSRGYQVWALFSNSFELERTRAVLRNSDLRDKVIAQLLIYARIYRLDGINIDFENVYREDAPYLTQFVREMVPLMHEAGLTVSIDITVKSSSPTWSLCYERDRLAEAVDYVMLMAYDQYPHNSSVAGPVSTIPWTEWAIRKTLEEVPAEKLVLGVPFYTRLWKETQEDGSTRVSPKAIGMTQARDWLRSENVSAVFQPDTGLKYAEKKEGQHTYKIWIEDEESMKKRLELARVYGLAGVAAWRRGFEAPEIWTVIEEGIK